MYKNNGPAYISRQFNFYNHFLLNILDIPYNPQTQDIVKQTHHTLKLQIKKFKKGEYKGTLLSSFSSLSRADFTRFQCNMFFKPITIFNTALFVLNSFNLPQGDILTKTEKYFEALKDTSLPLTICYRDGLTKQWKSGN